MPFSTTDACVSCDSDIDIATDTYRQLSCGCCYECESCMPPGRGMRRRCPTRGYIHNYSYRPRDYRPKGNYPSEVLMGIELEVGGDPDSIAGRVAEEDGEENTLYCKSDCSIYGTEIVSHPMTLAWMKDWGGYERLLNELSEDGCYSDNDNCMCGYSGDCDHEYGLHIHVSRNAFKQLRKRRTAPEPIPANESYEQRIGREMREVARQQRQQQAINHQMIWLMFIERNSEHLNGDMQLARRESSHYGAFKKSSLTELRRKSLDNGYFDESRYTAINCQNDKTYELRFFKSTVDIEEFYAAVEFADASVEYTRGINANDVLRGKALAWSTFVDWVNDQELPNGAKKYANLISQINKLGL